jgi:hypothetical protein
MKTKPAKVCPEGTPNIVTLRIDPWIVSKETSKINTASYLLKDAKRTLSRLQYEVLLAKNAVKVATKNYKRANKHMAGEYKQMQLEG